MTFIRTTVAALNIEKRSDGLTKEYRYFDIKYITVPNVIDMDVKDIRKYLKNFEIEYSEFDTKVISMLPESSIPINSTVRIMFG